MNDQQDQFFIEPEVQQLQDINPIQSPQPIQKPPPEEPKHIALKMIQIPKPEVEYHYQPFHFQHQQSSDSDQQDARYDQQSPFTQFYSREQIVYQRNQNSQYQKINETVYFAGAFLHRSIFSDGNYSESFQFADAAKQYYQDSAGVSSYIPEAGDLIFDSRFESGNLFVAFKINTYEYDLVMANDVNSTGNNQWFYFSVEGMAVDKQYTFSVVNFTKSDSLFNYGMAPAVYSMAQNKNNAGVERGWRRSGKQVSYKKGQIHRQNSRRMYYKLTFVLTTIFEKDKLFIAHSYPYSNQKLAKYINDKSTRFKDLVTKVTVGKSLSKRLIQCLIISQPINKKRDSRKAIIVMARQHPGQTQGSYVCEGVVEKLLSKNKEADFLLKNYVIYVIPMVNPDGVAFGHYRTNLAGKDLNRKWNATQKDFNVPQVSSIKAFLQEISQERDIRFILDLHGHSKKLNSFFYGNPCPENPDSVRIFPYTCSKLHSGVQFLDCTFASQQGKRKAARVYLSNLYRLIHVYTFESSFYGYFKGGRKIQFTPKEYRQLGATLVMGLFLQLQHEVKFQQSFDFNKKNNSKEYMNSPFVKFISELRSNKQLMDQGTKQESGSESRPEENQIKNQFMQSLRPHSRPTSYSTQEVSTCKTANISRKGARQINFNKPIRQIKFLQISRVNAVLPDKYQLGLQPIKRKQIAMTETLKPPPTQSKIGVFCQTQPRHQLKQVEFKPSQIQNCNLATSIRIQTSPQRNFSSIIRTNNRNIIFKFDMFGQTTSRHEDSKSQKRPIILKNAYSQTLITYSKEQGEKIKNSQVLASVDTPERDQRTWARNNSIRVESSLKTGIRREAEIFFNGMVKKLMIEKDVIRGQQITGKFIMQRPLSIKKKEISRK